MKDGSGMEGIVSILSVCGLVAGGSASIGLCTPVKSQVVAKTMCGKGAPHAMLLSHEGAQLSNELVHCKIGTWSEMTLNPNLDNLPSPFGTCTCSRRMEAMAMTI